MSRAILVLNAGSSSLKFALHDAEGLAPLLRGGIGGIGLKAEVRFSSASPGLAEAFGPVPPEVTVEGAIAWLLDRLDVALPEVALVGAGHRVVHGGRDFAEPVLVGADILARLEVLVPLAPNHQPANLAAIRAVAARWPSLSQVACFDTQFHRTQPRLAELYGLPRALAEDGILRYGFHGLSYEYIASVLPGVAGERAQGRVVVAHLGHGASMCAMAGLKSVATTMGFTAIEGLPMGERCGGLDPGVVLHLIEQKGMSAREVGALLNRRSGLLGLSGISADMRELEASAAPEAAEALDYFAYRAARELGSLMAALGGLDVLVFTAGIGEHSAAMRARICERARWAGVELDAEANARHAERISAAASLVAVHVVPTNEELAIARAAQRLLGAAQLLNPNRFPPGSAEPPR